jgi:ABC-type nickel/cobalt efflux system permease component RcnA
MGIGTGVGHVLLGEILQNTRFQAAPAAGFQQSQNGDQQRARPDQKKLQDLIKDGGAQAAESHIDGNRDGRNPDADVNVPSQDHPHHHRHGIHVNAAHQHGHEGERD